MVEEGPLMAFQRTAEEAQLEPNEALKKLCSVEDPVEQIPGESNTQ